MNDYVSWSILNPDQSIVLSNHRTFASIKTDKTPTKPPAIQVPSKKTSTATAITIRQRNVAQQRRRQEAEEFQKLGKVLPISRAISEQHIDKTTIVRLASSYIRLHHLLGYQYGGVAGNVNLPFIVDVIDGFLLVLTESGDILYVSETISLHLGLSQVEMTGNRFWNYLHRADAAEFQKLTSTVQFPPNSATGTFRIKSTLSKRTSRDYQNPNAGYKPIEITLTAKYKASGMYIVGFCQPHLSGITTTMHLTSEKFIVSTDAEFKIVYVDPHITMIFNKHAKMRRSDEQYPGWKKGDSFYSYVYPQDADLAKGLHINVLKYTSHKCQFIRLLTQDGRDYVTVEIFALSYSSLYTHGNTHRTATNHIMLICNYIG